MNKIILLLIFTLPLLGNYSFSQDSILNKPIKTKNFCLTLDLKTSHKNIFGVIIDTDKNQEYTDCNKVIPLSDSSFNLFYSDGNNMLFYKNIKVISYKRDNFTMLGVGVGAFTGCLVGYAIGFAILPSSGEMMSGIPSLIGAIAGTLAGAVTCGIIGYNTSRISFDLSKYPTDKKREKFLKVVLKYQVNF